MIENGEIIEISILKAKDKLDLYKRVIQVKMVIKENDKF